MSSLVDWLRAWVSALLVALAALLLAVAQWVDEEPVIYWVRGLVAGLVKGLEKAEAQPLGRLDGVYHLVKGEPVAGGTYAALPLAGDDE